MDKFAELGNFVNEKEIKIKLKVKIEKMILALIFQEAQLVKEERKTFANDKKGQPSVIISWLAFDPLRVAPSLDQRPCQ